MRKHGALMRLDTHLHSDSHQVEWTLCRLIERCSGQRMSQLSSAALSVFEISEHFGRLDPTLEGCKR